MWFLEYSLEPEFSPLHLRSNLVHSFIIGAVRYISARKNEQRVLYKLLGNEYIIYKSVLELLLLVRKRSSRTLLTANLKHLCIPNLSPTFHVPPEKVEADNIAVIIMDTPPWLPGAKINRSLNNSSAQNSPSTWSSRRAVLCKINHSKVLCPGCSYCWWRLFLSVWKHTTQ